eukprot:TRINITY_DN3037_c0_g1_i1.p1 TRINITY_DN3037_c0_g1~~TRINITY_DN3037_c0_g1_i1.p1  ORF type:complete len:164 (-),score=13.51 TRINITY_DN3037_c0_g1_i1:111-602(-)
MDALMQRLTDAFNLRQYEKNKTLTALSEKLGISVPSLIVGGVTLALFLIIFNYGVSMLTALVGFIYPAYMSFKVVESTHIPIGAALSSNFGKDDYRNELRRWLTYWIVYSLVVCLDPILHMIFGFLGPLYHVGKVLFFVFMFHPATKGSVLVLMQASTALELR